MARDSIFGDLVNETTKRSMNTDTKVDIDLIDPYVGNEEVYPQGQYENDFEILLEGIRSRGLIQPVELITTVDGRYVSVGGNSRCAAIRKLVHEEGLEEHRYVKAVILEMDDLEMVENNILSNGYRDKTAYTKMKEVEKLQYVIDQRRQRGLEEKGTMRDLIARKLGMGQTQAGTYMAVANKATDDVKELLKEEKITLEEARILADKKEGEQVEIAEKIQAEEITSKEVIQEEDLISKKAKLQREKIKEITYQVVCEMAQGKPVHNELSSTELKELCGASTHHGRTIGKVEDVKWADASPDNLKISGLPGNTFILTWAEVKQGVKLYAPRRNNDALWLEIKDRLDTLYFKTGHKTIRKFVEEMDELLGVVSD